LAIFLVGFLGSLIWNRIEGLTLSHARVFAGRAELRAPSEGYLQIDTLPNSSVAEGSALARMDLPETALALQDAQARVVLLQDRMEDGRNRLDLHLSMREEVRVSIQQLYSATALARFDAGIPIRPGDFNDQRSRLEQELRGLETDLDRATSELRRLQQLRRFTGVTAPTAGQVVEWLAKDQQFVRAGDVVGIFETDGPRVVRGWMDDRMASSLDLGMEAEITLQGNGETLVLAGTVQAVEAGENPAAPGQFGLIVTIAASDLSIEETRHQMRFNAPVEVVVKRNLLSGWLQDGE
jgi:multidrug efflux pump subunit AcrA (membrane-fusion protein)